MSTDDQDKNNPELNKADPAQPLSSLGQKRRAADLISDSGKISLTEFGGLMITSHGAVSDAARQVREALGESPGTTGEDAPPHKEARVAPGTDAPAAQHTEPRQEPPVSPVQSSTRLGDISSQFGKLIIDGMQAMSGAFRKGKGATQPSGPSAGGTERPPDPAVGAPQSVDIDDRPSGLSDRFTKLIMDKFRAVVDSRWQEKVKPERDSLKNAIERTPNPIIHEEVMRNMESFERRAQLQKLDASHVRNTYRSVLFLIQDPRKQSCLNETERLLLAMQVVRLAAHPEQVCPGRYSTADVSALETKMYNAYPSAVGHLVTEIALYNEFRTYKGMHIVLPGDELHPDLESCDPIGNKGMNRSYASQIFQHAAINIHYARYGLSGTKVHYRINPTDASEELITSDGRRLTVESSLRSINVEELCYDIAGDQAPRH